MSRDIYTKSSEVSQALFERLGVMTQANGAETNIGRKVYRGRKNLDDLAVPYTVLIEQTDTAQDRPGRLPSVSIEQRYLVVACLECDPDNPNDAAHAAIRDIKRAVFKPEADVSPGAIGALGGRVKALHYRGKIIEQRVDGRPLVFVSVELAAEFVEDLTNT